MRNIVRMRAFVNRESLKRNSMRGKKPNEKTVDFNPAFS